MRWSLYAGVSVTLAAGVVVKAMHQRANFYAASVYLAQSTANLMIMTNALLLFVGLFMVGLQRIMYGPLRPLEIEQLYEKAWIAITETCFAMTIFRGEMGVWFLVMFFTLLASRVWGWIGEGRVEILEQQPPPNPRLFHTRLAASLLLSALFNSSMLEYCVKTVLRQAKPDMMVMFGFEFAVLSTQSLFIIARYAISLVEILIVRRQKKARLLERRAEINAARDQAARQQEENSQPAQHEATAAEVEIDDAELEVPGWEEKGSWVLYLDLFTDFVKLSIYLAFFWILLIFYGFPIHIMRDVYFTFRSFIKRISDFRKYKKAIRDMESRYPDATAEEISREDVCIICREEMRPIAQPNAGGPEDQARTGRPLANTLQTRMRPKKLPCGHILHFSCLRSWLERQQICPTCRQPVVGPMGGAGGGLNRQAANAGGIQNGDPGHDAQNRGLNAQNQARVFQLGPLRVVFGRGRGNLYGDLANQIHHGEGVQRQPEVINAAGPQQFGFGFGIGARPAPHPPQLTSRSTLPTIQSQLQRIEQQIHQEINGLQLTADQLNVVRALQLELERLRIPQNIRPNYTIPPNSSALPQNLARPPVTQVLAQNEHQNMLQAGDERLPQGLTLPDGWTMMPLQRVAMPPAPSIAFPTATGPAAGDGNTSNSDSGMNDLTPSSSIHSVSQNAPTTTQPAHFAPEAPNTFTNGTVPQASAISSTTSSTPSHPAVVAASGRPESVTLSTDVEEERSLETNRSQSSTQRANAVSPSENNHLPSWGSQSLSTDHTPAMNPRTETSDSAPGPTVTPDHSATSNSEEKGSPRAAEREESKAARVEDCIEDMD